jgi:hypothetical protein
MKTVYTGMEHVHLVPGAEHWVQQEQAGEITDLLVGSCDKRAAPSRQALIGMRAFLKCAETGSPWPFTPRARVKDG